MAEKEYGDSPRRLPKVKKMKKRKKKSLVEIAKEMGVHPSQQKK